MADVTRILQAVSRGDCQATEQLLPLLYDELRELARVWLAKERSGQTIQATALVHEAWVRLVGPDGRQSDVAWNSRGHFFGAAAEAMRRILVDRARARLTQKRGGEMARLPLSQIEHPAVHRPEELLQLHEALERLESEDRQKAELVKLRFFAGLTTREAAEALDVSVATAERWWSYARAWLRLQLRQDSEAMDSEETDDQNADTPG